jgi:hypothetical protein
MLYIASDDSQSRIAAMLLVVPFAPGREVVVQRYGADRRVREKPVCEMAPDKAGAARDEFGWAEIPL